MFSLQRNHSSNARFQQKQNYQNELSLGFLNTEKSVRSRIIRLCTRIRNEYAEMRSSGAAAGLRVIDRLVFVSGSRAGPVNPSEGESYIRWSDVHVRQQTTPTAECPSISCLALSASHDVCLINSWSEWTHCCRIALVVINLIDLLTTVYAFCNRVSRQ